MEGRDEKGRFTFGNPSNPGNDFASKYKDEYCDKMLEFFEECEKDGVYPSFAKFARMIGVHESTLRIWAESNPRFHSIKDDCEGIQKDILVQNALIERYNPGFTKFLLSANHGMREKTESDVNMNANAEVDVRIEVVDKVEKKS